MLARPAVAALVLALSAAFCCAQAASRPAGSIKDEKAPGPNGETVISFIRGVAAPAGESKPTWADVEQQASELSAQQHAGRAESLRYCEPELKVCNLGIVWRAGNGMRLFLREAQDMTGRSLEREVCEINSFGDIRVCVDWDTNRKSRDMMDVKGHWYKVADQ
jgi:hypothetical protein